jgi:hypothetical protein
LVVDGAQQILLVRRCIVQDPQGLIAVQGHDDVVELERTELGYVELDPIVVASDGAHRCIRVDSAAAVLDQSTDIRRRSTRDRAPLGDVTHPEQAVVGQELEQEGGGLRVDGVGVGGPDRGNERYQEQGLEGRGPSMLVEPLAQREVGIGVEQEASAASMERDDVDQQAPPLGS